MIREAEQLAEEKRQVELEREKVRIDIQYREKVVTDARVIADSLLQFGKVFRVLPPADQKELIRLLVKEVTVNHFDPKKDPLPSEPGVFKARIRTKWYLVNMTLYASGLISEVLKKGKVSSDFRLIGSADRYPIRTLNYPPSLWASPSPGGAHVLSSFIRSRIPNVLKTT